MIYVLMFFCLFMVVIGKVTEKKIINPVTVFYAVWFLICSLTSLALYNINLAGDETYMMMFIGFISFAVGYYIWRFNCIKHQVILKFHHTRIGIALTDQFDLCYRWVIFLCSLSLVIYLIDLSVTFRYLISGNSLGYIRKMAQDSTSSLNIQSDLLSAIKTTVISPFIMVLQPIVAYDFWVGKKNKKLLYFNIILLLLRMLTDGSRSNLIYFVFHFVIGYTFVFTKSFKFRNLDIKALWSKKKSRRIMIIGGMIGVVAILWATMSRSGENARRFTYYYFTMEPYMFEEWSHSVDQSNLIGYGLASTHGFSFIILYILKNFKIIGVYPAFWHSISNMISSTQTEWLIITSMTNRANAYVSLFWYLYLDGRLFGIIAGMLIYGCIAAGTFWTAIKNTSPRTLCMYGIILQGLFMSFVRLQFSNITYAVAFMMIFLLYKRSNRSINK